MRKKAWISATMLVLYCGFIFFLSSIPGDSVPSSLPSDKIAHFLLYSGLGFVFTYFLSSLEVGLAQVTLGIAVFFFSVIYGLTDEIHQTFTPGRTFESLDMLANVFGGISGWLLYLFFSAAGQGDESEVS
ncbi:MAG TPA: VanZ family protein [Thermodesulfobacteriota bacterium]|nr:VanZ family protein [Thermodesulfobacteriota bacterium]